MNPRRIVIGITGGIAAYKSLELVRLFRKKGAEVQVVLTEHATHFVTPCSLQALSGRPVRMALFDLEAESAMSHIELSRWADAVLIAPASAHVIAKLAHGLADDLLTTLCLATQATLYIAPAMNRNMWHQSITQSNVEALKSRGAIIIDPQEGEQACGDWGVGRMAEPVHLIQQFFSERSCSDLSILITAGGTQEPIDPVRYLSNTSSGKMGYALAEAWRACGARVHLISAPTALSVPHGVTSEIVRTAMEMDEAVQSCLSNHHIFVSVAAVSDYRCEVIAPNKLRKYHDARMTLELIQNPDVLARAAASGWCPFVVGFSAETEDVLERAREKMHRKKTHMMIANRVGDGIGLNANENEVWVLRGDQEVHLPKQSKIELAHRLVELISDEYRKTQHVS